MKISKKIIICPECHGEGAKSEYNVCTEKFERKKCRYCDGKRVIREEIHHYQILDD